MKKKIFFAALGLIVLALALWFVPAVENIDRVMPAVEWSENDEALCLPTEIALSGKYYRYLFRDDKFIGTISVPGYALEPYPNINPRTGESLYTEWGDTVRIFIEPGGHPFTVMGLKQVGIPERTPIFHAATGSVGHSYRYGACLRSEDGRQMVQFVIKPGFDRVLAFVHMPDSESRYISAPAATREEAEAIKDTLLPIE